MLRLIALALLLAAPTAQAQSGDAAAAADAAAAQLEAAQIALDRADGARDRVKALTAAVSAYEAGLEAMRDGLRRAAIREAAVAQQLQAKRAEVSQLLGVLQTIGGTPAPALLLHPAGPTGTARAGMIVRDVSPAIQAEVDILRRDLDEVATLRALQQSAAQTLQDGLTGVQTARTRLSQAISNRTDLPRRFTEDPVKTALLIASTETLAGFASGLAEIADGPERGAVPDIRGLKGTLRLPVEGTILRRAGAQDAAGIARPGIVIATRPRALVTTPTAATIRYRGPLLDYGNVIILEPGRETLFVIAGLSDVYGDTGQVIPAGHPVGQMGGQAPELGKLLTEAAGDTATTGVTQSETLYMEVREGEAPVDPATWFRIDKD